MSNFKEKVLPPILAIVSSVGVVATAVSASRSSERYSKPSDECSKKVKLQHFLKAYWPTIAIGGATIASTVASTILSKKTEASLTAATVMLKEGWRKYKGKVKEVFGIEGEDRVLKGLSEDDYKKLDKKNQGEGQLYWEEHIGFFTTKPEDLAYAYADLNQRIQLEYAEGGTSYFCTLANLIADSKAKLLSAVEPAPVDLNWGWSNEYLMECYGYAWAHMDQELVETDDGSYIKLTFEEDMIFDPGNYGEDLLVCDKSSITHFKGVNRVNED